MGHARIGGNWATAASVAATWPKPNKQTDQPTGANRHHTREGAEKEHTAHNVLSLTMHNEALMITLRGCGHVADLVISVSECGRPCRW